MKKLFALTGFFLILFFSGCQENQITEPVSPLDETETISALDKTSLPSGEWLKLCCAVSDPKSGPCQINGTVFYNINRSPGSRRPAVAEKFNTIVLTLVMDAQMCKLAGPTDHNLWSIKGSSKDKLVFVQDEIITVGKSYSIRGRDDIYLRVVYNVEMNGVSIKSISLQKANFSL